ncbi:MAG: Tol-Pal system beta propeller repeat protein TolB [Gammaproteobacteria bacterium]|nr:Tol-Pal system beta propeller repeat protein TolB [Gammaproteobacteria bacterium]
MSNREKPRGRCTGFLVILVPIWLGCSFPALSSVLTIEVKKGTTAGIPIAIVPFKLYDGVPEEYQPADIIDSDLGLSGRFESVPRDTFLSTPSDLESVQYKDWRLIKSEALVVGKVFHLGNDQYEIRFRLIDVFRETQLAGQKFIATTKQLRQFSHRISNIIYEKLTGIEGAFDTKIAYVKIADVKVQGEPASKRYLLQVADADGWNPKTVLESPRAILSPAWSPDGNRLAYVSFEKGRSMIFLQDIWSGKRSSIAGFRGLNSAPSWSPDGKKLALTLSRDGNPDIYIFDVGTSALRRLTRSTAIDTEPAWSPDGKSIVFTSGRSGAPQLYQIAASGGPVKRLTFDGKYNAGASFSPDGESIVLITDQGNGHKVGIYSTRERTIRVLTSSQLDESPSFSPNGEIIIYATQKSGRKLLATVSIDGQVQQTLKFQAGSVREPAWSPFKRKL